MASWRIKYKGDEIVKGEDYFTVFDVFHFSKVTPSFCEGCNCKKIKIFDKEEFVHNIFMPFYPNVSQRIIEILLDDKYTIKPSYSIYRTYGKVLRSGKLDIPVLDGIDQNHIYVKIITKPQIKQYMRLHPEKFKNALK